MKKKVRVFTFRKKIVPNKTLNGKNRIYNFISCCNEQIKKDFFFVKFSNNLFDRIDISVFYVYNAQQNDEMFVQMLLCFIGKCMNK